MGAHSRLNGAVDTIHQASQMAEEVRGAHMTLTGRFMEHEALDFTWRDVFDTRTRSLTTTTQGQYSELVSRISWDEQVFVVVVMVIMVMLMFVFVWLVIS